MRLIIIYLLIFFPVLSYSQFPAYRGYIKVEDTQLNLSRYRISNKKFKNTVLSFIHENRKCLTKNSNEVILLSFVSNGKSDTNSIQLSIRDMNVLKHQLMGYIPLRENVFIIGTDIDKFTYVSKEQQTDLVKLKGFTRNPEYMIKDQDTVDVSLARPYFAYWFIYQKENNFYIDEKFPCQFEVVKTEFDTLKKEGWSYPKKR